MRRKRCQSCQGLYLPEPQTYRQQKTCSKGECRAWRIREKWRRWSQRHPLYSRSRKIKQRQWRQKHGSYWGEWRKKHDGYVARNRKAQRERNARNRGLIAKPTEWETLCIEKLRGIKTLRLIAKPTGWEEVLGEQIDGILRYLRWRVLIAKPTDMDKERGDERR